MGTRLSAFAHLAGELGQLAVSMGGILLTGAGRQRPPRYYEDHF